LVQTEVDRVPAIGSRSGVNRKGLSGCLGYPYLQEALRVGSQQRCSVLGSVLWNQRSAQTENLGGKDSHGLSGYSIIRAAKVPIGRGYAAVSSVSGDIGYLHFSQFCVDVNSGRCAAVGQASLSARDRDGLRRTV
jgi:hypothetical protein